MPKKGTKSGRQRSEKVRPETKAKPGRPFKERIQPSIEQQIEILASYFLTDSEISAVMEIPRSSLQRNYGAILKRGRDMATGSLKKKQFQVAMSGNVTMLIWLGKVLLGQKEIRDPIPGDIGDTKVIYKTQWGAIDAGGESENSDD